MRTVDIKKHVGGIEYYVYADATRVVTGEVADRHMHNYESRCSADSWRARDSDGNRCRSLIASQHGPEVVAQIDTLLGLNAPG